MGVLRSARVCVLAGGECCGIPPWANPRHTPIVSIDHMDRLDLAPFRHLETHLTRLGLLLGRHPGSFMTPQAWPLRDLTRLPGLRIDLQPAPTVFQHEAGRRTHVV